MIGLGYSGYGSGKNNPAAEGIHDVGPIPRGLWTIVGPPFDSPTHGPFCLKLEPCEGTSTLGRDGFLLHGDSITHMGSASHGCIIQSRTMREQVWTSGDTELEVI